MEETRIKEFRLVIWRVVNLISQFAVDIDYACESIRQQAEKCSPNNDIRNFVEQNKVGINPLAPVVYESFYKSDVMSSRGNTIRKINFPKIATTVPKNLNNIRKGNYTFAVTDCPFQDVSPYECADDIILANTAIHNNKEVACQFNKVYTAKYDYDAKNSEEISLLVGDKIVRNNINENKLQVGWMFGTNQRTCESGLFPSNYVK